MGRLTEPNLMRNAMLFRKGVNSWACVLPAVLLTVLLAWGCAKRKPVTFDSSGLRRPKAQDSTDSQHSTKPKTTDQSPTKPPKTNGRTGNGGSEIASGTVVEPPDTVPPSRDPFDESPTPPKLTAAEKDLYQVPQGTSAELTAYQGKLDKRLTALAKQAGSPLADQAVQQKAFAELNLLGTARITAAERVLADEKATAAERRTAVESKFQALELLARLGEDVDAKRDEFARSLAEDPDERIRTGALAALLDQDLRRFAGGEQVDAESLAAQLEAILNVDPQEYDQNLVDLANATWMTLRQSGNIAQAARAMRVAGTAFAKSKDAAIAGEAEGLLNAASVLELEALAAAAVKGEEDAAAGLLATAKTVFSTKDYPLQSLGTIARSIGPIRAEQPEIAQQLSEIAATAIDDLQSGAKDDLRTLASCSYLANMLGDAHAELAKRIDGQLAAEVEKRLTAEEALTLDMLEELLSETGPAMMAEHTGNPTLAVKLYASIGAAAQKLTDPAELDTIKRQTDAGLKRVSLVGKPLEVEGLLADGTRFYWSAYAGKVVLVDFWATWCAPCLRELPNIEANYKKYHKLGFEVVGVNIDDDAKDVQTFFADRGELPWTTIYTTDDKARGFSTPLAKACGVTGIPFVVLIGKDGNVLAIHVRGAELGKRLAEIFGEVETPPEESMPDGVPSPDVVPPADEVPPAEGP
jgi:thiol-disulfide isomerase/thioredoxin